MQATLEAKAEAAKTLDLCAACGCQLAVIGGEVWVQPRPDQPPVPEDSDRARRKLYVGCGSCRRPVPLEHPRQRRLDQDWAERERQDRQEAERKRKAAPPPTLPHTNPEQLARDLAAAAVAPLVQRIESLEAEVAALKQPAGRKR